MGSFIVLVIYLVFCMFACSSAWVFTNINYVNLLKSLQESNDGYAYDDIQITDEDIKQLRFSLIYPGTKWCGPGNIADSYNDLGPSEQADMCCRNHDHCPDIIDAGQTKHNLTNEAFYTRLSCKCDETFRTCLRQANSSIASQIGNIYFNALCTMCFRRDFHVIGCKKRGGWLKKKCLKHKYDTKSEKTYQWFDVPNF